MKELSQVLVDAAEFARAAGIEFVEVVKPGFDEVSFTVYNTTNEDDPAEIYAVGICNRKNGKSFTFDIPLYKRGALDFLSIRSEDTGWEIDEKDLFRIKSRIAELNEKLSEY